MVYDKAKEKIFFDIFNQKTSISKARFYLLLRLTVDDSMINPDSIITIQLLTIFYDMRYIEVLTTMTKFKKSCLHPQWNGLFTLLFKGLSKRVAGSDGASKTFMTLLYGLYYGVNMDYGSILWTQLLQSPNSDSHYSEISCGRFWTLVTQWAMDKFHIPTMADSLMSSIATFHTKKSLSLIRPSFCSLVEFQNPCTSVFLGKASSSMNTRSFLLQDRGSLPPKCKARWMLLINQRNEGRRLK